MTTEFIHEATGYDPDLVAAMFAKYGCCAGITKRQFTQILMFIHLYPTQQQVEIAFSVFINLS